MDNATLCRWLRRYGTTLSVYGDRLQSGMMCGKKMIEAADEIARLERMLAKSTHETKSNQVMHG